jgi:hypothetical protein
MYNLIYQQLWGYKIEERLYLGVREEKRLNTTVLDHPVQFFSVAVRRKSNRPGYTGGLFRGRKPLGTSGGRAEV